MYVRMYVRMSHKKSKGRPLRSRKRGGMDTVFCRGRHRLHLVRLRHLPWPGGHVFVGSTLGCVWKKWEFWSKSVGENSGKRKWPWFKMKTASGFWANGFMAKCKGILEELHDDNLAQVPRGSNINVIFHDIKLEAHLPRARGHVFVGPTLGCIWKKWEFWSSQWEKIRESASDRDLKWRLLLDFEDNVAHGQW